MELREAYTILELDPGASEEAVRDARKTLVKVWHPDRHANDPELQKRAEIKLAEINAAFEAVRTAGFPSAVPAAKPAEPAPPPPKAAPAPVPPVQSTIEIVPRRRVRWGVIVLVLAAVGVGAYFAVVKLHGGENARRRRRTARRVAGRHARGWGRQRAAAAACTPLPDRRRRAHGRRRPMRPDCRSAARLGAVAPSTRIDHAAEDHRDVRPRRDARAGPRGAGQADDARDRGR